MSSTMRSGRKRRRRLQRVGTGAGDLDVEAFVAQGGRDEVGDVRLVVDDEDSCIGHVSILPGSDCANAVQRLSASGSEASR